MIGWETIAQTQQHARLVCGATVENAAHKSGKGERTAYRRLADPKFQAELKNASQEMFQRTAAVLSSANIGRIKT
jgi:hypothetical protein